jgi:hypothetical protein
MITDDDLESAIAILQAAKQQRRETYLKGCINYITRMKPSDMEI